jgi:hypothetical protein
VIVKNLEAQLIQCLLKKLQSLYLFVMITIFQFLFLPTLQDSWLAQQVKRAEPSEEWRLYSNKEQTSRFPLVAIFLRKGYGLGAQALVGGSLHNPVYTAAWPTGEFGGMGIEGAVKLGYKKELESLEDLNERKELFNKLVAKMYEVGQAIEAASFLEIDAVIDPIETRNIVLKAFQSAQGNR